MLIICNGAPKGGSTWINKIISSLGAYHRIPSEFQDPEWANPSIDKKKIDEILSSPVIARGSYLCKQHWSGEETFRSLINHPHIRVINIIRDLRDVLVSRYFHDMRVGDLEEGTSIDTYYFEHRGKPRVAKYIDYQNFWHMDQSKPQPFLAIYERLHVDFENQVAEMFDAIGIEYTPETIGRVKDLASFDKAPVTGEGQFHRKGIVGDWRNHLSPEILEDLDKLIEEKNYNALTERVGLDRWVNMADHTSPVADTQPSEG